MLLGPSADVDATEPTDDATRFVLEYANAPLAGPVVVDAHPFALELWLCVECAVRLVEDRAAGRDPFERVFDREKIRRAAERRSRTSGRGPDRAEHGRNDPYRPSAYAFPPAGGVHTPAQQRGTPFVPPSSPFPVLERHGAGCDARCAAPACEQGRAAS